MGKGTVVVTLVAALLSGSQAAHAECSRGAACLSRWRKPQPSRPNPGQQAPAAAPPQAPSPAPQQPPAPAPVAEPTVFPLRAMEPTEVPIPAPDPSTVRYPPGKRPWYGWQLLIIDGAVLATGGTLDAAHVRGDGATAVGLSLGLVFDIAPPIVHAVHHRSGIAWASFGIRSTLPFTVLLTTLLVQPCSGAFEAKCLRTTAANVSAYLGIAAASALDASLFAWEGPTNHQPSRATLEWAPIVAPRTDGATVGVLGVF